MQAKNDRVICKLGIMPERLVSGLFLPDEVQKDGQAKVNIGKVISFGPGMMLMNGEFIQGYDGKIGDVISWEQFGAINYEIIEKGIVCVRNSDIGAVLEPKEYSGWEFDQEAVDAINEKNRQELSDIERKQKDKDAERLASTKVKKYECWTRDCKGKNIEVQKTSEEPCDYCGKLLTLKQSAPLAIGSRRDEGRG